MYCRFVTSTAATTRFATSSNLLCLFSQRGGAKATSTVIDLRCKSNDELHHQPRRTFATTTTYSLKKSSKQEQQQQQQPTAPKIKKTVLVLGSSGALGSSVSRYLSREVGCTVIGADIVPEQPSDFNMDWELDAFLQLPSASASKSKKGGGAATTTTPSVTELSVALYEGIQDILARSREDNGDEDGNNDSEVSGGLDAIICANGGWSGDPPVVTSSLYDGLEEQEARAQHVRESAAVYDQMLRVNLNPVLAAGLCAQHCCNPGALVVVMGATAALGPTLGMMGYGVSKAATHHVVQTLGAMSTQSMTKGSHKSPLFPTVVGILPTTIDTPGNRKAMPKANFAQWTRMRHISEQVGNWLTQPSLRPHSGSLVKVHPDSATGGAVFELAR